MKGTPFYHLLRRVQQAQVARLVLDGNCTFKTDVIPTFRSSCPGTFHSSSLRRQCHGPSQEKSLKRRPLRFVNASCFATAHLLMSQDREFPMSRTQQPRYQPAPTRQCTYSSPYRTGGASTEPGNPLLRLFHGGRAFKRSELLL